MSYISETLMFSLMLFLIFLQVFGTLYLPTLTAEIVNNGIVKGNISYVWRTGGIMLAVALLTAGISILETYLSISSFFVIGRNLRNDLFRKIQHLTVDGFNSFGTASMITRCTHDVERVQDVYTEAIEMLLPAPIMAIAGLILAFRKSPSLALLIVLSALTAIYMFDAPSDIAIKLAQKMKSIRKRQKITQKQLAARSNVSYATLRKFEKTGQISLESQYSREWVRTGFSISPFSLPLSNEALSYVCSRDWRSV